jgi:hypothetical protein
VAFAEPTPIGYSFDTTMEDRINSELMSDEADRISQRRRVW